MQRNQIQQPFQSRMVSPQTSSPRIQALLHQGNISPISIHFCAARIFHIAVFRFRLGDPHPPLPTPWRFISWARMTRRAASSAAPPPRLRGSSTATRMLRNAEYVAVQQVRLEVKHAFNRVLTDFGGIRHFLCNQHRELSVIVLICRESDGDRNVPAHRHGNSRPCRY